MVYYITSRHIRFKMTAAIAAELSNIVTCPVCLEIPKNPKAFPCLHFYCESCIDDIKFEQEGPRTGQRCPICRTFAMRQEIKSLHFMKELLDAIQSAKSDNQQCGNCKDQRANWRCENCKDNFCDGCRRNHDGFKLFKSHKCFPLGDYSGILVDEHVDCPDHGDEYVEFFCKDCQKLICRICNGTEHKHHKAQTVKDTLEVLIPMITEDNVIIADSTKALTSYMSKAVLLKGNLSKEYEDILSQISAKYLAVQVDLNEKFSLEEGSRQQRYDEERARLDAKFEKERLKLEMKHNSQMNILESEYSAIHSKANGAKQQHLQGIEENIRNIDLQMKSQHSITQWANITLSAMKGASLLQACLEGLIFSLEKQAKKKPLQMNIEQKPILAFQASTSVVDKTIGILVNPPIKMSRGFTTPLDDIRQARLVLDVTKQTGFDCFRITLIGNDLWCSEMDGKAIHIFSTDCVPKRKLLINEIKNGRGMAKLGSYVVISAENGLYMIDATGASIQKLDNGNFVDVTVFENKLFALNLETVKVQLLESSEAGLEFSGSFSINRYGLSANDTIQASKQSVFIGLHRHDAIAQFTHIGEPVATYGTRGAALGQLSVPRICGADENGTILVADVFNNRFVTLTNNGRWTALPVAKLEKRPQSAIAVGDKLVVLCNFSMFQIFSIAKAQPHFQESGF